MRAVIDAVSRNRRSHREAEPRKWTGGVIGIEQDRIDTWCAGDQRLLGKRINLGSVKTWPKQREFVGRDEDSVGISADVGIVTPDKIPAYNDGHECPGYHYFGPEDDKQSTVRAG